MDFHCHLNHEEKESSLKLIEMIQKELLYG